MPVDSAGEVLARRIKERIRGMKPISSNEGGQTITLLRTFVTLLLLLALPFSSIVMATSSSAPHRSPTDLPDLLDLNTATAEFFNTLSAEHSRGLLNRSCTTPFNF